jgi:hypothetical protein
MNQCAVQRHELGFTMQRVAETGFHGINVFLTPCCDDVLTTIISLHALLLSHH